MSRWPAGVGTGADTSEDDSVRSSMSSMMSSLDGRGGATGGAGRCWGDRQNLGDGSRRGDHRRFHREEGQRLLVLLEPFLIPSKQPPQRLELVFRDIELGLKPVQGIPVRFVTEHGMGIPLTLAPPEVLVPPVNQSRLKVFIQTQQSLKPYRPGWNGLYLVFPLSLD